MSSQTIAKYYGIFLLIVIVYRTWTVHVACDKQIICFFTRSIGYFTIWINTLIALYFIFKYHDSSYRRWFDILFAYILLVALVYHLIIKSSLELTPALYIRSAILHTWTPILFMLLTIKDKRIIHFYKKTLLGGACICFSYLICSALLYHQLSFEPYAFVPTVFASVQNTIIATALVMGLFTILLGLLSLASKAIRKNK